MHEAVEDGVCEGGVADGFVPPVDGELACHDGGGAAVAVLEDFQQVTRRSGAVRTANPQSSMISTSMRAMVLRRRPWRPSPRV
jgi:hypothetical protein